MTWQPDYTKEYTNRIKRIHKLKDKPELWLAVREYYKTHPIEWIEDWCVTYDPRNKNPLPKVMPFILFPKQKEFIQWLYELYETGESGLCEKCRDVGASWLCVAFTVWLWLFHDGVAVGWGSRKAEYVDTRGDPKAIFPKIRQIIGNLPRFMLPEGFNPSVHATYMKIINPVNGATITGEGGDNIGRGGRTSIYFKDESSHYERPELIEAALGDNTNVQIDISSVNGSANVFYRRRMAGEIWQPNHSMVRGMIRVFIFDWRDHPNKSQEWYDARRDKAEREGLLTLFAQEVDRDYSSSVDRIIIEPKWVKAAIDAHVKLGFAPTGKKCAGQDVADEGGDKNALAITHGVVLLYAESWGGSAGEAALKAVPTCLEYGVTELYYDCIGVGAGFKNQVSQMPIPPALRIHPWNAANTPINPTQRLIPSDYQSPKNEDFFANMKAQAWWNLRTRFYKTYQAIMHGEAYPHEELISLSSHIENLHQLTMELSQATHKYSGNGKLLVDKKPEGARSPNLADAVAMAYLPAAKVSILDSY